jgi:hypothetical protein
MEALENTSCLWYNGDVTANKLSRRRVNVPALDTRKGLLMYSQYSTPKRINKAFPNETPEERQERLRIRREKAYLKNPNRKPQVKFNSEEERKEHECAYQRAWAARAYAENPERYRQTQKRYRDSRNAEQRQQRKEYKTEYSRQYRELHPEAPMLNYKKLKDIWTMGIDCRDPLIWRAAETKGRLLIAELGYTDVFQPDFGFFIFDAMAKKDGRVTVFQITTLRARAIKRKHIELANYLGFEYFIIQVKPTLDCAYIQRIVTSPVPDVKTVTYYYSKGERYELT